MQYDYPLVTATFEAPNGMHQESYHCWTWEEVDRMAAAMDKRGYRRVYWLQRTRAERIAPALVSCACEVEAIECFECQQRRNAHNAATGPRLPRPTRELLTFTEIPKKKIGEVITFTEIPKSKR